MYLSLLFVSRYWLEVSRCNVKVHAADSVTRRPVHESIIPRCIMMLRSTKIWTSDVLGTSYRRVTTCNDVKRISAWDLFRWLEWMNYLRSTIVYRQRLKIRKYLVLGSYDKCREDSLRGCKKESVHHTDMLWIPNRSSSAVSPNDDSELIWWYRI